MQSRGVPRKRGQLVLVAAVVLAITFVGLALVVNTVIFTENLATRQSVDAAEAETFRATATDAVRDIGTSVNRHDNSSRAALAANLSAGVRDWSRSAGKYGATRGAAQEISVVATTPGSVLAQRNSSRNFTAGNQSVGTGNWTLARETVTRRFRQNVSRDSLYATSETGDLPPAVADSVTNGSFHVQFDNGSRYRVYTFRDGNGTVRVFAELPTGTYVGLNDTGCRREASRVTVDYGNGTVGGAPCRALDFVASLGESYHVSYRNATVGDDERVTGTYELVVRDATVDSANFSDDPGVGSPSETPAFWSITARLRYVTPDLRYVSSVQVVPGT